MPGRIRRCLNLNYSNWHDPHVTTKLVDVFKSSPAAKCLLKRVPVFSLVVECNMPKRTSPSKISL